MSHYNKEQFYGKFDMTCLDMASKHKLLMF